MGGRLMRSILTLSVYVTLTCHSGALAQPPLEDEFDSGGLDWSIWCPCQINMTKAPIVFLPDSHQPRDRVARITADDVSLGGNICRLENYECRPPESSPSHTQFHVGEEIDIAPELPEPLGPSLVRPTLITDKLRKNPYCTDEIRRRAKAAGEENLCIQRQELRFQERHRHDVSDPHLYSFRIRMPKQIEDRTNSIRWVTAQWKHKPISRTYCREFDCDVWGGSFIGRRHHAYIHRRGD